MKLTPFLSSISGSNLELTYVTSDDFSASAEHNPRKPHQQSDENQGEPQVRRDVVHRLCHLSSGKNRGRSTKNQSASAISRAKSTPSMIGTMKSVVFIADAAMRSCATQQQKA